MRRMDRYSEDVPQLKRSEKNQELYQDVATNPKYTNITDVRNANAYELNTAKDTPPTREAYQKKRLYQDIEDVPKTKKDLDNFNYLYPKREKKIYDINSVLEEARKNREEKDELDEKRKLKYTSYNILAGINLEELAKYREDKKNRAATPEEEEIRELVDTIASKTLAGEMSKDETVEILSDLLATNILDKVDSPEEIDRKQQASAENNKDPEIIESFPADDDEKNTTQEETYDIDTKKDTTDTPTMDNSFYTKSMDLSNEDLELSKDFEEKKLPLPLKILIFLLIIAIIVIAVYFIYLKIK